MSILRVLSSVAIPSSTEVDEKITNATDHFIRDHLPDWLGRATPERINRLRDCFTAHYAAQDRVQQRLAGLTPVDRFATMHLSAVVAQWVSEPVALHELEWREVRRAFKPSVGINLPSDTLIVLRQPALLRLMQNFHAGATFYDGTGLVRQGDVRILSGDADSFAAAIHALDLGARYQQHLAAIFTPEAQHALAQDKRAALALCTQIALLQGTLTADEANALQHWLDAAPTDASAVVAYPGALTVLGEWVTDAVVIQLRGAEGADQGLLLYSPNDTQAPLRRFSSWEAMNTALAHALGDPDYRRRFSQTITLARRAEFLERLAVRLEDPRSDLELTGPTVTGDLFAQLAAQQIQRVKADAAMLLVSNAQVDDAASKARLSRWETLGLDVLNLAGLFVPAIGAALLAQLTAQTASDAYTGLVHWHRGHRHEALEHLLGVAETVAVGAAMAVGITWVARGFRRSAFVDALEPVQLQDGRRRLWHRTLEPFVETPDDAVLQADGRFSDGERHWIRIEGRFYRIHQPVPGQGWRLRHPLGEGAYEPAVQFNGERCWCLRGHRPLEWRDSAQMLDTLWPHEPPLTATHAERILRVACMDQDELRGLLVEHRQAPCNLKLAIQWCAADRRIEAFYDQLARARVPTDTALLSECRLQSDLTGLTEAALHDALIERQGSLRPRLFEHLIRGERLSDPVAALVRRDFPGLPEGYIEVVLQTATQAERSLALAEQRLPLAWATQARSLLQLARLNKALAGLCLNNTYGPDTMDLVMPLLRRVRWPNRLNLELRADPHGALLARLVPQAPEQTLRVLVHEDDGFHVYDDRGLEDEASIPAPRTLFQALVALLSPHELTALDCRLNTAAEDLRQTLLKHLPQGQAQLRRLAGWTPTPGWFNPGQRLPDGRVGYLLSGRGPSASSTRQMLRERVRALYSGFTDTQVESYLSLLLRSPGSAFEVLLNQEISYERLDDVLNEWASSETRWRQRTIRNRLGAALRRCWRLQGPMVFSANGQAEGMLLDLSDAPVPVLPSLPERTDFGHVTQLIMTGMGVEDVPQTFMSAFTSLQHLNLASNRLTRLPAGIEGLTMLRSVRLAENRITYSESLSESLQALFDIQLIDLRFNPLRRFAWRHDARVRLHTLLLSHTQLEVWPTGLLPCTYLEYVDLRFNQIRALPAELLNMPFNYRHAFAVDGNPLAPADMNRLTAADPGAVAPDWSLLYDEASTRAAWLNDLPLQDQTARAALWDRLNALPDNAGFLALLSELIHAADYVQARDVLRSQVWEMIERLDTDAQVRGELFARANEPRTCADCAADRFSELRLQIMVADAQRATGPQRERELLTLGRRLFRLDRLDQFVRADIAERLRAGQAVDEVEVSLAYRVRLAQELDLPAQPRHMRFERVANVSAVALSDALETVRAAERSVELTENLSRRAFWRDYLVSVHPAAFAAVRDNFAARGNALDEQGETLTSEQYRARWQALDSEREAALHVLTVHLTDEALARHPLD